MISLISILSLFFALVLTTAVAAEDEKEPVRSVQRPVKMFDFGLMPGHSAVSHRFWFTNESEDTIHIESVKPGCGCLSTPSHNEYIAPGDSTAIQIIFKSGLFREAISKRTMVTTRYVRSGNAKITLLIVEGFVVAEDRFAELSSPYLIPTKLELKADSLQRAYHVNLNGDSLDACEMNLVEAHPNIEVEITDAGMLSILPKKQAPSSDSGMSVTVELICDKTYRITLPIEVI
jgi:hypothetical protein